MSQTKTKTKTYFSEVLFYFNGKFAGGVVVTNASAPEQFGPYLLEFLNDGDFKFVNGPEAGEVIPTHFNSILCLGAYLIGQLKGNDIGRVSLTTEPQEEEEPAPFTYEFHQWSTPGDIFGLSSTAELKVREKGHVIWRGEPKDADFARLVPTQDLI